MANGMKISGELGEWNDCFSFFNTGRRGTPSRSLPKQRGKGEKGKKGKKGKGKKESVRNDGAITSPFAPLALPRSEEELFQ